MQSVMVRPVTAGDAEAVAHIYSHYVLNSTISFEEEPVLPDAMSQRIQEVFSSSLPWLIAAHADRIVGYAFAGKWKGRCAYRYSAETSVYLDPEFIGRGIGTQLYQALLAALQDQSIHVVIGGVALPNPASVALHERLGFAKVAHFKEVGYKFGHWIDVGYWQRSL
ncbi:MAG TPA: arsinothricin resistance N-acetyltransferase ArsN1 family B [Burkholderiaceae bacterium]|jgi:phosphinothricin acetyltransferase|nr:arsinothricin resistance N-acetyltransferase ArsN1 family B [Burkholderiaceae bacterium]